MRDSFSWSLSIGRWFGVPLRIHLFFLLFAMLVCCVEWHYVRNSPEPEPGTGVATILVLLVSVLAHELAHVLVALNLGGRVTKMTLMPWGGASDWDLPEIPKARLLVHGAGLAANACLFGICALIALQAGRIDFWELINPLKPQSLISNSSISIVYIVAWVNFQLMIVNLIPVYPFDASQLVRNLLSICFPQAGKAKIESGVLALGTMVAIALLVSAWFLRDVNAGPLQPTWFVLLSAGAILFFSARYGVYVERHVDKDLSIPDDFDYLDSLYEEHSVYNDYGLDDDELDNRDEEEMISQWLQEKQEAREQLEREIEQEEERQVDSILKKLHNSSVEELSDDERAILYRVSARYRRRRQIL
jgi:Zn-dependent protease